MCSPCPPWVKMQTFRSAIAAADLSTGCAKYIPPAQEPGGGLITPPDPTTLRNRDLVLVLTARHRLPAVYPYRFFLTSGGLMSYGIFRQFSPRGGIC